MKLRPHLFTPAHNGRDFRLSWQERIARNARRPLASPLEVTIHGLSATFAQAFGFKVVPAA